METSHTGPSAQRDHNELILSVVWGIMLPHTTQRLHSGAVILNASESLQIMMFDDVMCIMIRALMCAHVYVCGAYKYFDSRKTFITDR